MSIQTWIEEALPNRFSFHELSDLQAVEASIQKWEMLKLENLKRHDVFKVDHCHLEDSQGFSHKVGMEDCALCILYPDKKCDKCPIFKYSRNQCGYQYIKWQQKHDPELMIILLNETKQFLEKNKCK